jgi:hypothetical protein
VAYNSSKNTSINPISPGCGKKIYNSREEAQEMIQYIQENRVVKDLHSYQCEVCGLWHLSHKSKDK